MITINKQIKSNNQYKLRNPNIYMCCRFDPIDENKDIKKIKNKERTIGNQSSLSISTQKSKRENSKTNISVKSLRLRRYKWHQKNRKNKKEKREKR